VGGITTTEAAKLIAQFTSGQTKAYLVHLAEGVDDPSRAELDSLRTLGLLRKEVVAIHGTALTPAQLAEMGQAGMRLVWSPQSNLALYGQTTNIPAALAAGVKVALAPDWTLSGTNNLLAELKVADRINKTQWSGLLSDEQLVAMATSVPAEIAGMQDKLGRIVPGAAADLVVVKKNGKSGHRALIDAQQSDVLLTVVGGQAMYGEPTMLGTLGVTGFDALTVCGEARGLLVRDATVTNGGTETLGDLATTLTNDGVTPWPLEGACPAPVAQTVP
jgi:cytosine/adenosine deaminase-related metal-dependent hydrolase